MLTEGGVDAAGLTAAEAAARLAREGYNELPRRDRRTPLRIVLDVLREPMLALLLAGGVVYLALGDSTEALILLAFATISVVITVVQESRTERVLEALRDLTSPRALVIRDGRSQRIPGREVVRGDLVLLGEGDRVPADALLVRSVDLHLDESVLTGESVPVGKAAGRAAATANPRPGGEGLPYVFSGSLVVRGSGLGEVTAIGSRTEIGRIGESLRSVEVEPPRLRTQTRRLVLIFAVVGASVSVVAVLLFGLLRGGWLEALLAGIALGMSMLPEELPVVLTVFMAMGAWRISKAQVLTRRPPAIETLGSATVLCTDKTGTLTENRMAVAELRTPDGKGTDLRERGSAVPVAFRRLVWLAAMATTPAAFDPMEHALQQAADQLPMEGDGQDRDWQLAHTLGLRPDLLAMSQMWRSGDDPRLLVAAKGAPEAIADLCSLPAERRSLVMAAVEEMAERGLRVLAVASGAVDRNAVPASQRNLELDLEGLVGLADPVRAGVREAVSECRGAGIRVVMITGDYPATAAAIAEHAGLVSDRVLTGDQIQRLSDSELAAQAAHTSVFARVMPQQKLRIVEALKSDGEIVGMTGDGVNDAPSLKAAHIGIAMGRRGTDVAREASSLVLLDDDFGSIVQAIRLGRRIYDNLRKAIAFIFAVHVPIATLALVPLLFGSPILLAPVHIAFLEMVIDPVCSLVFESESEETDAMRRPPRPPQQALIPPAWALWSLFQGACASAIVLAVYVGALNRRMPEPEVRAITYFSLVAAIVALIFVNRSFRPSLKAALLQRNRALGLVLLAVVAVLAISLLWPLAQQLFQFGPLHIDDLGITAAAAIALLMLLQGTKLLAHPDARPAPVT